MIPKTKIYEYACPEFIIYRLYATHKTLCNTNLPLHTRRICRWLRTHTITNLIALSASASATIACRYFEQVHAHESCFTTHSFWGQAERGPIYPFFLLYQSCNTEFTIFEYLEKGVYFRAILSLSQKYPY